MTRLSKSRGSTRKKRSETLTAHTARIQLTLIINSGCKTTKSYKEITPITLVKDY